MRQKSSNFERAYVWLLVTILSVPIVYYIVSGFLVKPRDFSNLFLFLGFSTIISLALINSKDKEIVNYSSNILWSSIAMFFSLLMVITLISYESSVLFRYPLLLSIIGVSMVVLAYFFVIAFILLTIFVNKNLLHIMVYYAKAYYLRERTNIRKN